MSFKNDGCHGILAQYAAVTGWNEMYGDGDWFIVTGLVENYGIYNTIVL